MRRRRCRTTEDVSFSLLICQTSTQQATDAIITLNQEDVLEFVILSAVDSMSYTPSKFVFSNYFFEIEDCLQSIWLLSCKLIDWLIRPLWSCAYGSENCPEEWSNSGQQRQLQIAKECCSDCHTRNQLCCPKEEEILLPKEAVVRVLWLPCNLMWGTGNKEMLLPPRRIGIPGN